MVKREYYKDKNDNEDLFDHLKESLNMNYVKGFAIGSILKYLVRFPRKGQAVSDIRKVVTYTRSLLTDDPNSTVNGYNPVAKGKSLLHDVKDSNSDNDLYGHLAQMYTSQELITYYAIRTIAKVIQFAHNARFEYLYEASFYEHLLLDLIEKNFPDSGRYRPNDYKTIYNKYDPTTKSSNASQIKSNEAYNSSINNSVMNDTQSDRYNGNFAGLAHSNNSDDVASSKPNYYPDSNSNDIK